VRFVSGQKIHVTLGLLYAVAVGCVGAPRIELLTQPGRVPGYLGGPAYHVRASGPYAYATLLWGGVAIFDVQNPSNAVYAGGFDIEGDNDEFDYIQIVSNRAYVTFYD
jgi:hypothetical protein